MPEVEVVPDLSDLAQQGPGPEPPAINLLRPPVPRPQNEIPRTQLQSAEFRFVGVEQLESLGITPRVTPGDTLDSKVNKLHREISGLTGTQAVDLSRIMARRLSKAFSAEKVGKLISESCRNGFIDTSPNLNKDLVKDLWKYQILDFVA